MTGMAEQLWRSLVFSLLAKRTSGPFHLDLLGAGALHFLGGKAALNMQALLSQLLRFDILVTTTVSSVLTAPKRQFY